ncbi:MAG: hypothetical protein M5U05_15565 [Anaerolineales bacterium]|jgi:hypothetical protein|nr:hypothetical protein [Anaerolineales bacterium]
MKSIINRLPNREQVVLLFLAISLPINFWALVVFLQELPAYVLRMSAWEILSVLAYILTLALVDSLILLAICVILLLFMPTSLLKGRYTAAGTMSAYLIILWLIPIQYQESIAARFHVVEQSWFVWLWLALLFASFALFAIILVRSEKFERMIRAYLERVSLLASVYLFFNFAGLLIVIARNLIAANG